MPAGNTKIIITGAGIAGLSLGWELAKAGANVTILEKDTIASGASGASGAWLEPRPGKGKLRALEWQSLKRWPHYASSIEQQSGINIGFRQQGVIHVADSAGTEKLRRGAEGHIESGWQLEWLEGDALQKFEPGLSKEIIAGYFLPQVCHLDARQTCHALAIAFENVGGVLLEHTEVKQIETTTEVRIEIASGKVLQADKIVLASAHRTNAIAGLPADMPKSRPVRGVLLELATDNPIISRPVKTPDYIILPLSNRRLMAGSSHEDREDQLQAPQSIIEHILKSVSDAVPEIANLELVEKRVGIRSLVGDGLLRLGQSRENQNIYYSLSHAGAGFLRAPVIAGELAAIILDTQADISWIQPFYRM